MTFAIRSPEFQQAFVAMSYFWGARADEPIEALPATLVHPRARELLSGLCDERRATRAATLGAELAKLATSLEQRSLLR